MKNNNIFNILMFIISFVNFGQDHSLHKIIDDGKIGYINNEGKIVIAPVYLSGNDFSEGLAAVRLNGTYGFIDEKGKYVIEPQYDFAYNFLNGKTCVYKNGERFFIDRKNNRVLDNYGSISFIDENNAIVETKNKRQGVINLATGQMKIDTVFRYIGNFENGVAIVRKENDNDQDDQPFSYAVIDTLGNFVVDFNKYLDIKGFVEGYSAVEIKDPDNEDGSIDGVIDTKGNLLFRRPYQNNSYIEDFFHDGLAIINLYDWGITPKDNSFSSDKSYEGYISLDGRLMLNDPFYKNLKDFSQGRAFLWGRDKKYHIIDNKLNPVTEKTFDDIQGDIYRNGYAIVENDGLWGIIDTKGDYVVQPKYDEIHEIGIVGNYFFFTVSNEKDERLHGVADLIGNEIIPPVMEYFDDSGFHDGLLKCIVGDKLTYFNKSGKAVWQEIKREVTEVRNQNIDYMLRGHFYAHSKSDEDDLGGFANSDNSPQKIDKSLPSKKGSLSVFVDTAKNEIIGSLYNGYRVYVMNGSKKEIAFPAQDSRLYMKVQAMDLKGDWRDIEYLPTSWCGNSYHTLTLESNYLWTFLTPVFDGAFKTKLRIELKYKNSAASGQDNEQTVYSNEFESRINPGQFWNKTAYNPNGIMDPYND